MCAEMFHIYVYSEINLLKVTCFNMCLYRCFCVQELYSDITLACDGKYYEAHRLVLSTCSEYFEGMFQRTQCKHPVVVLKDISCEDLESLLSYMYDGEVNVLQENLSCLIKAAECLKIKGLAVPDTDPKDHKEKSQSKDRSGRSHASVNNNSASSGDASKQFKSNNSSSSSKRHSLSNSSSSKQLEELPPSKKRKYDHSGDLEDSKISDSDLRDAIQSEEANVQEILNNESQDLESGEKSSDDRSFAQVCLYLFHVVVFVNDLVVGMLFTFIRLDLICN